MPAGTSGHLSSDSGVSHNGRGRPSTQDQGSRREADVLARQLSEAARAMQAEHDPEQMLAELIRSAVELVPGAQEASLSIVEGRRRAVAQHPTGELPLRVDALQTELGEGPCLSSAYEHETVRVSDVAHDDRWPRFSARASALGVGSMLSVQLFVHGDDLGALNLFSRHVDAFDDQSEHVALLFASHAAVASAGARRASNLLRGLDTRDVIGQAKGILMERHRLTADQAFTAVIRLSQNSNRPLRDLAEELARTGQIHSQGLDHLVS